MLKLVSKSSNKKLGNCAATYRAGTGSVYSTCPNSCKLKPDKERGAEEIDTKYLQALLDAVPEDGISWTYTHFDRNQIPKPIPGKTVLNISSDTLDDAIQSFQEGYPTTVVVPSTSDSKVDTISNVRFVRCPAEYQPEVSCSNCGGSTPLCARPDRKYIIKFTAHGSSYKRINLRIEGGGNQGGCYGSSGPVSLQWRKTIGITENDSESLLNFVKTLPRGSKIRHHVVGDIGSN